MQTSVVYSSLRDSNKILVRHGYNRLAKRNLNCRLFFEDFKHLQNLNKNLKQKSRILDVGCGSGIPVDKYFIEKKHEITGIDISEEQIKTAEKNLPQGKFFVMDMEDITLPDNYFDAVVSFYSIYHTPKENHFKLFKKIHSLLTKKGLVMIAMGSDDKEGVIREYEDINLYKSQYEGEKSTEMLMTSGFFPLYHESFYVKGESYFVILARKSI